MRTNIVYKGISLLLTVLLVLGMGIIMPVNQVSASGYDASAAVSYAKTYWSNYNSSYVNYNDIGNDGANFVSQCLHAGGLEMTDGIGIPVIIARLRGLPARPCTIISKGLAIR